MAAFDKKICQGLRYFPQNILVDYRGHPVTALIFGSNLRPGLSPVAGEERSGIFSKKRELQKLSLGARLR